MSESEVLSKEGVMEEYDLSGSEYLELQAQGLVPDHSEKSEEKFKELFKKGVPFTSDEILFLGRMDVVTLQKEFPAEAEEYMDM